jgi:hypothetical protein
MSLSSELEYKSSYIRQFLDKEFPHLRALCRETNKRLKILPCIAPPLCPDKRRSLVGGAIDYRIRLCFSFNPKDSHVLNKALNLLEIQDVIYKEKKKLQGINRVS